MRIQWQAEDGYAGGSRPQYFTIDDSEFEGLDENEKEALIEEYVRNEFEQKVSFSWQVRP